MRPFADCHVHVLGEPSVAAPGGGREHIGGRQRRLVLSLLVAARPRGRSREDLAQAIWGDDRPATADKTIQTHVHHLRRHLDLVAPGEVLIASTDGGYRITPACRVDLDRLESLAAPAPPGSSRLDTVLAALRAHRPPYEGFEDVLDPEVRADATRAERLHAALLEAGGALALEHDRPGDAVDVVAEGAARHPYREGLWDVLVRLRHADGDQAAALRTLHDCRARLVEDLGIEPGPWWERLEAQVLTQDPSLSPLGRSAPTLPAGLRPAGHLHGRDRELDELRRAVTDGALVTVTGPAGVGATRLVADFLAEPPPGAVVAVDAGHLPPGAVGRAVVERAPSALVVVDGADHHLSEVRRAVRDVRRDAPSTVVVTTGRCALGLDDEVVVRLGPLPTAAAVAVLQDTVGRDRTLPDEDAEAVVADVGNLPGAIVELGVRLRGRPVTEVRRALSSGVGGLDDDAHARAAASVDRSAALLSDPARTCAAVVALFPAGVTATVLSTVATTRVAATVEEAVAVHLLRLDQGPVGAARYRLAVPMAPQVRALLPHDPSRALRRRWTTWAHDVFRRADPDEILREWPNLRAAVDWVVREDLVVDEFDLVLLASAAAVRHGRTDRCRAWPESALGRVRDPGDRVSCLLAAADGALVRKELKVLQSHLDAAADVPITDGTLVDRRLVALAERDRIAGDPDRGQARLDQRVRSHDAGDHRADLVASRLAYRRGDFALARDLAEDVAAGARVLGDHELLVDALAAVATVALASHDHRRSRGAIDEAVELAEEHLLLGRLPSLLGTSGNIAVGEEDPGRARRDLRASLALVRRMDDHVTEGITLANLANVAQLLGEPAAAIRRLEEALDVLASQDATPQVIQVRNNLADAVLAARGDARRARDLARDAATDALAHQHPDVAWCLEVLARAVATSGEPELAARLVGAADARRAALGRPPQARLAAELVRLRQDLDDRLGGTRLAALVAEGAAADVDTLLVEVPVG